MVPKVPVNSPYAWLRQTSKFHQQASFVNKIFCICTFCAWVFFSTLLPWELISVDLWPFSSPKPCWNFSYEPKAKFVSVTGLMWRGPEATSAEIQYWWHVITQIWLVLLIGRVTKEIASTNQRHYSDLGSDTSSVWNFWARFSDFPWRENMRWCHEISAVFSG